METFNRNREFFLAKIESCELVPDSELVGFLIQSDASPQVIGTIIMFSYSIKGLLSKKRAVTFPEIHRIDYQEWVGFKPRLINLLMDLTPRPISEHEELEKMKSEIENRFSGKGMPEMRNEKLVEALVKMGSKEKISFLTEKKFLFSPNSWPYLEIEFLKGAYNWVEISYYAKNEINYFQKSFLVTPSILWFIDFFEAYEVLQADLLG